MKIKRKVESKQFYNRDKFTIEYEREDIIGCFVDIETFMGILEKDYIKYYEDFGYLDLFALEDEKFLKDANIEFIKDEKGNIIPIGIVDFQNGYKKSGILRLSFDRNAELYKVPDILSNIEKAIKIKYKAINFMSMVKERESFIELS